MDLTKVVFSMFTSGSKDGQTWPRSVFKSGRNLCAQGLNFQQNERPELLRLNSTGDTASEDDFVGETRGVVKKGILGDYTQSHFFQSGSVNNMPCQSNSYQSPRPWSVGSNCGRGWFTSDKKQARNSYNFSMAQRQYRHPTFGVGCPPIPPWHQYGHGYPYWLQGNGSIIGNPFGGNGYPVGYTAFQGMATVANAYQATQQSSPRQVHKKTWQNKPCRGKASHNNKRHDKGRRDQGRDLKCVQSVTQYEDNADIGSVTDSLRELHITSEKCDSQSGTVQGSKAAENVPFRINMRHIANKKAENSNMMRNHTKEKDIPSEWRKICDNCRKCSNKVDCMNVGSCLLSPSERSAKITLILGDKENMRKLSNVQGKNGYHEKNTNNVDHNDSGEISDEIGPGRSQNDHLHHGAVGVVSSSHSSPPSSKPKCSEASPPPNTHLIARVILQRNSSSKRKQRRRSAKKRQSQAKGKNCTTEINVATTAANKKQKVNHRNDDDEVPSATASTSTSQPCNAIAYILGISPPGENETDVHSLEDGAHVHYRVSVHPEEFSFSISSSEDTDFSDDEVTALSEDDADIWNSFSKCDDPYNPLNFLNSTSTSAPIGLPKSSSAPTLLSPEVLENDNVWRKDTPPFSPPKPEALTRTAKKVHFATDMCMVQVHTADDWERKGPWEQLALDSQRFLKRIKRTDDAIGYIFTPQHRQKIQEQLQSFNVNGEN